MQGHAMKKILIRLQGDDSDLEVLDAGLATARIFEANLECLYVLPRPSSVILDASPVAALTAAFGGAAQLDQTDREGAQRAHETFRNFCRRETVAIVEGLPGPDGVSATWREAVGRRDLIAQAALSDLVVETGVWDDPDTSSDFLFHLLIDCGRPVLLPHLAQPQTLLDKVAVAWDNTLGSARALAAAMPLLVRAQEIIVLHAAEDMSENAGVDRVLEHLGWHNLKAQFQSVPLSGRPAAQAIAQAAVENGAGLLVMGAYGHSHIEESIFGGFTQDMLNQRSFSILLFH
jgi:nucleotide-binding universal stress UspA family protein